MVQSVEIYFVFHNEGLISTHSSHAVIESPEGNGTKVVQCTWVEECKKPAQEALLVHHKAVLYGGSI